MYKQLKTKDGHIVDGVIQRLSDTAFVPFNPENIDYQKYLEWLAEGNTPEPADE